MPIRHAILLLVIIPFFLLGCSHLQDALVEEDTEFSIEKIKKIAVNIENYCYHQGYYYTAQGMAINDTILYRLYDTGLCKVYDISDIDSPKIVSSFELKSRNSGNHCNCAQLLCNKEGYVLLYIAGLGGKCFVERVTLESSTLIQTITLPKLNDFNFSQNINMICGDDGYLWMFGESRDNQTLYFAKVVLPDIQEQEVVLSSDDLVDLWCEPNYIYNQSVWQGGMINDGYLYFVFGMDTDNKHIVVYDTTTHKKTMDINLNGVVSEEPEDCDLVDGQLLLSVNGGKGYYLIPFKK